MVKLRDFIGEKTYLKIEKLLEKKQLIVKKTIKSSANKHISKAINKFTYERFALKIIKTCGITSAEKKKKKINYNDPIISRQILITYWHEEIDDFNIILNQYCPRGSLLTLHQNKSNLYIKDDVLHKIICQCLISLYAIHSIGKSHSDIRLSKFLIDYNKIYLSYDINNSNYGLLSQSISKTVNIKGVPISTSKRAMSPCSTPLSLLQPSLSRSSLKFDDTSPITPQPQTPTQIVSTPKIDSVIAPTPSILSQNTMPATLSFKKPTKLHNPLSTSTNSVGEVKSLKSTNQINDLNSLLLMFLSLIFDNLPDISVDHPISEDQINLLFKDNPIYQDKLIDFLKQFCHECTIESLLSHQYIKLLLAEGDKNSFVIPPFNECFQKIPNLYEDSIANYPILVDDKQTKSSKLDELLAKPEFQILKDFPNLINEVSKTISTNGNSISLWDVDLKGQNKTFWDSFYALLLLCENLAIFKMANCQIGPEGCGIVSCLFSRHPNIIHLNLGNNLLLSAGCVLLSKNLVYLPHLVVLHLWLNRITDEGVTALSNSLATLKSLKTLGLDRNSITDDGMIYLMNNLKSSKSIKEIYLHHNSFTENVLPDIEALLPNLKHLEWFMINDTKIPYKNIEILAKKFPSISFT